jgi:hypothetical protein
LDDLIAEYHMERSSFAKRVDEIFQQALAAPVQEPVGYVKLIDTPFGKKLKPVLTVAVTVGSKLYTTPPAAPVQEFVCSTGLCHYKPAAPDLQAELEATNRQVEILSDALAESRREVAELQELIK